jgi:hypothetical protein
MRSNLIYNWKDLGSFRVSNILTCFQEAEITRLEHMKLVRNMSNKMNELERERSLLGETVMATQERLRVQEQKIFQQKAELCQEKELFDKLRSQALCPDCLKLVPPAAPQQERSQGDGLDVAYLIAPSLTNSPYNRSLEHVYLQKDSKLFNDMISDYYGPEIFKL